MSLRSIGFSPAVGPKILSCVCKQVGHLFNIKINMTESSVNCSNVEKYSSAAVLKSSATAVKHQYLDPCEVCDFVTPYRVSPYKYFSNLFLLVEGCKF